MKKVDSNYDTCGFPKSTINKVKAILEEKQINYLLINRSENYEVEEEEKSITPASASFDLFKNFEERGERLKELVNKIK